MEGEDPVILASYKAQRRRPPQQYGEADSRADRAAPVLRNGAWAWRHPSWVCNPEVGIVGLSTWSELLASHALQNLTEDRVRTVLDAFTQGRWHHHVVMPARHSVPHRAAPRTRSCSLQVAI